MSLKSTTAARRRKKRERALFCRAGCADSARLGVSAQRNAPSAPRSVLEGDLRRKERCGPKASTSPSASGRNTKLLPGYSRNKCRHLPTPCDGVALFNRSSPNKMKILPLLAASLLIATSLGLSAKTIKYPDKDPAFSITIPDDWTATSDKDGNLDCEAGDGSKFSFSIISAEEMKKDEAELKTYLPTLAKTMGDGAEIKDVKVGEIKEMTTPKGVKLIWSQREGAKLRIEMVISLAAFAPKKDIYFIIMAAAMADVDKAHDQTMGEIINSITPISGKE